MENVNNMLPMSGGPLQKEEAIKEKQDDQGNTWSKVYFGSGAHFKNWLSQVRELFEEEDIEVEEVLNTGLTCYEESAEKAYRIWVKKREAD
jgi:hypothetical protein